MIEKLQQIYGAELVNKDFAYNGEKSLFAISAIPQNKKSLSFRLMCSFFTFQHNMVYK